MAYNSVANGRAFMGAASPWAKSFATVVASAWAHARAKMLFADGLTLTGRPFLVLPKVGRSQIEALALYDPKLKGNNFDRLLQADMWDRFDDILPEWKSFGRAFVHFCVDPSEAKPFQVLDHHGVVRAVNDLAQLDYQQVPTLRQFDQALGCSLVDAREELDRQLVLHGWPTLPQLPELRDEHLSPKELLRRAITSESPKSELQVIEGLEDAD